MGEEVKVQDRFLSKTKRVGACLIWTACKNERGYGFFAHPNSAAHMMKAHRAAWLLFKGDIPHGAKVLHTCDNRSCVNVEHLYIGDQKMNALDRDTRGRNGVAKLSVSDVEQIRASTEGNTALAARLNVSRITVSRVRRGVTWSWA